MLQWAFHWESMPKDNYENAKKKPCVCIEEFVQLMDLKPKSEWG